MKLKDLSKEMGSAGGGMLGGLDTMQDREPVLTSSSLSMPREDAQAYVALAKELGLDRVSVIGGDIGDVDPQLFGPVWFIRSVGRTRPRMHPLGPNEVQKPWDYNLAVVRRLMFEEPGAAALEATWRVGGLIALLQLVDAHQ